MNMNPQQMVNIMWNEHARSLMPDFVRVIGRVVGDVKIKDLNKTIVYNQVIDIEASIAIQSNDLHNASKNRWVEVIQGKSIFERNYSSQRSQPAVVKEEKSKTTPVNMDDIKEMIVQTTKETIQSTLQELLKNQTNQSQPQPQNIDVNEIAKAVADKINIPENVQTNQQQTKVSDKANNIFIEIDTNKDLKSNINEDNIGVVTKQTDKKIKSKIQKIKDLKKLK